MGIEIISVKAVGLCSKHRTKKDEILKYKNGEIIKDKDISCVGCELKNKKIARKSFGEPYECRYEWDKDTFVQCGGEGLVLCKEPYTTAFFEAFPKNPSTFIRGEGKFIEDAEKDAWDQLQKFKACREHIFERKGYTNGAGFCKSCGLFKSKAFEPTTICCICKVPTDYSSDINNKYYCERHYYKMAYKDMSKWQKMLKLKKGVRKK